VAEELAFLTPLAMHILPNTKPFENWLETVTDRLLTLYPKLEDDHYEDISNDHEEELRGLIVAREALDPSFDYPTEQAPMLPNQFSHNVDHAKNPFLCSPRTHRSWHRTPLPAIALIFEEETMERPIFFTKLQIQNKEISYKWDVEISSDFTEPEYADSARHLTKVLWTLGYKASVSLTAAVCEWIIWRLSNYVDTTKLSQLTQFIEALWVGSIDSAYLKPSEFSSLEFDRSDPVEGPIRTVIWLTYLIKDRYLHKSYYIIGFMRNLILLARYVTPDEKVFDEWFLEKTHLISAKFPCRHNYAGMNQDEINRGFDDSEEETPPREIFFQKFVSLDDYSIKEKLNEFLLSVNYEDNPFLYTADEMVANGFKGESYRVL